jgi:hypothetical protein
MSFARHLLGAVVVSLALAPLTYAQAPEPDPAATPLPSALTSGTKIFLGNAGDQENADCLRAYNVFYQGVGAIGRYQMVLDPAAADLVLELHYEIDLGQSIASNDSRRSVRQFRVVIIDPHTHTVLWSLTERTNYATFQKNRNKNLDETVSTLVADFASLTSAQPPNNKSRVPHNGFPLH